MSGVLKMKGKQMSKAIYVCATCNSDEIRQLVVVNYNSRKELYPNLKFQKNLNIKNEREMTMSVMCNNCDDDVDKDIVVKEMVKELGGLTNE